MIMDTTKGTFENDSMEVRVKDQSLYTCGRMHKAQRKLKKIQAGVVRMVANDVACKIVCTTLQKELEPDRLNRLMLLLEHELGCVNKHETSGDRVHIEVTSVPKLWVPTKPLVTLALLDELTIESSAKSGSTCLSIGVKGGLSKLLARGIIAKMRTAKGEMWLQTCGEFSQFQLNSPVCISHTISRALFDLLVYVHARAVEIKHAEVRLNAVLDLHSAGQTLSGKMMRGSGVVFCEEGRGVFTRACKLVREGLQCSKNDELENKPATIVDEHLVVSGGHAPRALVT